MNERWRLGSGTDRQHLITDGQGDQTVHWDPISGEGGKIPGNLPSKPADAYAAGFEAGVEASKPTTFGQAFKTQIGAIPGDFGTLVGADIRRQFAQAVDELIHIEPPPPKPQTPSKLKNAAKSAGHAAADTGKRFGRWAIKTGLDAFQTWQDRRRRSKTSPSSPMTNDLLSDGTIDGQWTEVK